MNPQVETSLEAFAVLMARLDDPFADRASVLAVSGLDEAGFERVRERWYVAFEAAADERGGVGKRFGDAYEHALRRLEAERRGEEVAEEEPLEENNIPKIAAPRGEAPPPAPELSPAPEPPLVPEGMRNFADLHETQPVFAAPGGKALPFDAGVTSPLPPQEDWTLVPAGMRHFTDVHGTQPTAEAPRGPVLPFQAPPRLSLQQYASLHVELTADPARAAVILSLYRLDEEQRRRVEAYWQERINADPEVRVAWEQACNEFRMWLQRQRGKGA